MEAYFLALLIYHSTDFQEGTALQGSRLREIQFQVPPSPPPVPQFMSLVGAQILEPQTPEAFILVSNVLGLWWC